MLGFVLVVGGVGEGVEDVGGGGGAAWEVVCELDAAEEGEGEGEVRG